MSSPFIWNGNFAKSLKQRLNLNDKAYILPETTDPTVSATDAPRSSLVLQDTGSGGKLFIKQDTGSSTNWNQLLDSSASDALYLRLNGSNSITSFIDYTQTATPASPAASHNRYYFKSNNRPATLDSTGQEVFQVWQNTAFSTFIGTAATTTTAVANTAAGFDAGLSLTTGAVNALFGTNAGKALTTGSANAYFGVAAGEFTTTGGNNTCVGRSAGNSLTTAGDCTYVGSEAGKLATIGTRNTCIGMKAGTSLVTAEDCTYVGGFAGIFATGSHNTVVGSLAFNGLASTGSFNTAIGRAAMSTGTITGTQNTALGYNALLELTTGIQNTACGAAALRQVTTGSNNSALGLAAGVNVTTGSDNIFLGANNLSGSAVTASNEWVVGSQLNPINNAYFGRGFSSPTLADFTMGVAGATGTDISANASGFKIAGARGTGTGAGGHIFFQTAPAGATGSTQNALVSRWEIEDVSGHLLASTDNVSDIGGVTRPRDLFLGRHFSFEGKLKGHRTAVADANYTTVEGDYIVAFSSLTLPRTVNLVAAATAGSGTVLYIKDEAGTAGTNNITVDPAGAETVDGSTTILISANFGVARLYSNGANWFTF